MIVVSGAARRSIACALLASFGPAVSEALAQSTLPFGIPDLCATATITSAASGPWSSPATWSPNRNPIAGDVVRINSGHVVTYDAVSDAAIACIGVRGALRFRSDINTRLKSGTLMVMPSGELTVGTPSAPIAPNVVAELVIANQPLDGSRDPEQFGTALIGLGRVTMHGAARTPTFARLAAEPRAGQTTLTLAQSVSGWRVGDRIVLPDTRQLNADERFSKLTPQFEEFTIAGLSGSQVTLNRALTFDHEGARNAQNVLEFLPHIGNLSRNVVIRSENPNGTRGHTIFVDRVALDIRYVLFKDLGRTTNGTPVSETRIGRYPLHVHHVPGPPNPQNTGHQFTIIGNAVADSRKWPLTIHNSHYGLIRDNVVFNGLGAGIVTEDGNESYNEFVRNFGVGIFGDVNPRDTDGRDGSIFWFNGFNHIVRDNVAANAVNRGQAIVNGAGYNFTWPPASSANTRIPRFRGADVSKNGEFDLVDMQLTPIPEFSGNEAYGAMPTGIVIWHLGTDGYAIPSIAETVIRDFTGWHLHESAFFGYPNHNITFDSFVVRGQRRALGQFDGGTGWWAGDYKARNVTVRRANVQGMSTGFDASIATEGSLLIEDSFFSNWRSNISVETLATPGTGATPGTRTIIVRNTRFDPMQGAPGFTTINMNWTLHRANSHPQTPDRLFLYDYDGVLGSNFRVFYTQQGSQDIAGGRATCSNTRPEIDGLVCSITGPVSPTLSAVSPTAGNDSGGTSVTISGANFGSGARVEFGGLPASSVTVASPTRITAVTPAHAPGLASVNVTNTDGQRDRLDGAYTFGAATGCTYSLDSSGATVAAGGGSGSVSVTTSVGCAWTAASNVSWITITSGSTGSGGGTVGYTAASNPGTTGRSGTLTIAGQTFTVTQPGQSCSYTVSPTTASTPAAGGTGTTGVTTAGGCSWTAVSNATWISVTAGSSGNGNGTVSYNAAANPGTSTRTGTMTVAGQTVTVTQQGQACSFTVSPTSDSAAASGDTGSVTVTAASGCTWTAASNASWITFTSSTSGSGNGTVSYSVGANTGAASRTGTLTVAGQTVTVTQQGQTCSYTVSPISDSVAAAGGARSASVTAPSGCSWTALSNVPWIGVTSSPNGNGDGTVTYSVDPNIGTSARTGTLTVASQTLTVTQQGQTCTYTVSPTTASAPAAGGAGTTSVTAASGCSWTATSNASWITITAGGSGSGNGTVSYSVSSNGSTASRTGTVTVAGQTVTVTQQGQPCTYTVSPTSVSVPALGGTGSVSVTTLGGCTWTAVSNVSWITITSGASGGGNGTVSYSVETYLGLTARTGTLLIGGQTVTVTQQPVVGL